MNITVTTAEKLDASQSKSIKTALAKKFPKASITELVDENLIAGIKISIGSQEYDASAKAKLADIKLKLNKLI